MKDRSGFTFIAVPTAITGPVVIYGFSFISVGGSEINLRDGADENAPIVISETTTTSYGLFNYKVGIVFANGCYVDSLGLVSASIFYEKI